MKKKIVLSVMTTLFVTLILSTNSITADYPTGTLGYSDAIAVGEEFYWDVVTHTSGGTFASYYDTGFYVGDIYLEQGDEIKLVVLEDPDTALGAWYEIYVDGVKAVDPDYFFLGYGYIGWATAFISPVTYINATGTYNLYEELMEEFNDVEFSDGYSYTDVYYEYTLVYSYHEILSFALVGDILTTYLDIEMYASISGGGYNEFIDFDLYMEMQVNVDSGLLGLMKTWFDYSDSYGDSGYVHFLLDSEYTDPPPDDGNGDGTTVPYIWGFSVLGLAMSATIVILIKRKRN